MTDFADNHLESLARITDQYRGRRTYQAQFARDVERLAVNAIQTARTYVEVEKARVGGLESGLTLHERRRLERAEAERDELLVENATLKTAVNRLETRIPLSAHAESDEGTVVTFNNPKGKYDSPLPWTVGEWEAICYHLRVAGATDTTPVEYERYLTKSVVPWPDLLDLRRPGELEAPPSAPARPVGAMTRLQWVRFAQIASVVFALSMILKLGGWP